MATTITGIEQPLRPPPSRYLVLTGLDMDLNLYLYIDTSLTNAMGVHRCDRYCLQSSTGVVKKQQDITPKHAVQQLGWFSEPATFETICLSQPVQLDTPFDTWILALMADLDQNYAHLWIRNRGNWV
jgi:hypothetical protein